MGGANAQDPQGWRRPWELWGVGLRLKEQKGPRCAPPPWSQRAGTSPGSPAGFLGSSADALLSSPAPPVWGLRGSFLPASPDLPGLRGADLVWLPLLLHPRSPYVLPVHLGVPPISLGVRVPHQRPADTLVVGTPNSASSHTAVLTPPPKYLILEGANVSGILFLI